MFSDSSKIGLSSCECSPATGGCISLFAKEEAGIVLRILRFSLREAQAGDGLPQMGVGASAKTRAAQLAFEGPGLCYATQHYLVQPLPSGLQAPLSLSLSLSAATHTCLFRVIYPTHALPEPKHSQMFQCLTCCIWLSLSAKWLSNTSSKKALLLDNPAASPVFPPSRHIKKKKYASQSSKSQEEKAKNFFL